MGAGAGDHFPHSANICHSFGAALTVLVIVGDEDINGACPSPGFWRVSIVWMPVLQRVMVSTGFGSSNPRRHFNLTSLTFTVNSETVGGLGGGFDPIMLCEGGAFGNWWDWMKLLGWSLVIES